MLAYHSFFFCHFDFFALWKVFIFLFFANQPIVHSGGSSRRTVCGCGYCRFLQLTGNTRYTTQETWHMTHNLRHVIFDRWHVTHDFFVYLSVYLCLFWYQCYYPHTSRDSVSPICRIFNVLFIFLIFLIDVLLMMALFSVCLLWVLNCKIGGQFGYCTELSLNIAELVHQAL